MPNNQLAQALLDFGLDVAPVTGEVRSGQEAVKLMKQPAFSFVDGKLVRNFDPTQQGFKIGLAVYGAVPIFGAVVRGAKGAIKGAISKTDELIESIFRDYVGTATTQAGRKFKTGQAVEFPFLHNNESATKLFGPPKKNSPFGRFFEPTGRYVVATDKVRKPDFGDFDAGVLRFENPLVINNNNLKWKEQLSKAYGGKRGAKLSQAVIDDGFDGIVTVEKGHTSEILDLTTFNP